jgi:hypothetical protein
MHQELGGASGEQHLFGLIVQQDGWRVTAKVRQDPLQLANVAMARIQPRRAPGCA